MTTPQRLSCLLLLIIRGVYSPNNHGATPTPHSHVLPSPFICHPRKQFLDIVYAILCNFMRVFSEFLTLSVRDNDPKMQKNTKGVGKHIARFHFYREKLRVARYCHGMLSVRPSVRLSVTLRYRDHIGSNSWEIISRLISLTSSLFADPNMTDLVPREHPQILAGIGVE